MHSYLFERMCVGSIMINIKFLVQQRLWLLEVELRCLYKQNEIHIL